MVSTSTLQQPRLRQRYSIQKTLGARLGRRTLLGYDHSHNRQVVIKYLCFDDPLQPSDTRRFCQEIAILKSLDHPAISPYLDSFDIDEHGYRGRMLVQGYIPGQSLYALAQRTFTETDLRNLAHQILDILSYLHDRRSPIIHRDIKPSSLVLSPTSSQGLGKVYLVDFGLVQPADDAQNNGAETILISGTPGYRPPEQLGDRAVPATDLYSLGATLVHLATGKLPSTLPQRGLRILFGHELGHMSRPLKAWLRWLTQPKQHKRPPSAQAARQGLEQADTIFAPTSPLSLTHLSQRIQRTLLERSAPANTRLKIFEYSQTVEIVFPPLGWKNWQFFRGLLQTTVGIIGIGLSLYSFLSFWPDSTGFWQHFLTILVRIGGPYLSLRFGWSGVKAILVILFRQISIQLLPDIILLGYRFPCRPVNYQINTYKQDVEDIDLQPGSSNICFCLRRNRTLVGKLSYQLSATNMGVSQSEISWINDILQLWLKQRVRSV